MIVQICAGGIGRYDAIFRRLVDTYKRYLEEPRTITGRDHAPSLTNDMPDAGGGGASAGVHPARQRFVLPSRLLALDIA